MTEIRLPDYVVFALSRLKERGFEAYAVGGCVRDALMGRDTGDYDIATGAEPSQVKAVFSDFAVIDTGARHGTVTVLLDGGRVEITTFRTEGVYSDNRHPDSVTFAKTVAEDLGRRDFTINAVCYSPESGLIDLFGGVRDIEARVIRCVGEPDRRFSEDALRILRALRFSSVLGFSIEERTSRAIFANKDLLSNISAERIRAEFGKLICGAGAPGVIIEYSEVIGVFIPAIPRMRGFDQKNPHHAYDVLKHCALAMEAVPPVEHLRLAALLHDMGKPDTFSLDQNGVGHFYGHERVGAELARGVLSSLKYDGFTIERVHELIRRHGIYIPPEEKVVRRWLSRLGEPLFRDLMLLKKADAAALGTEDPPLFEGLAAVEAAADRIVAQGQCLGLKDLAVKGDDLIADGMKPGRELGLVLNALLRRVLDGALPNEREALLACARDMRRRGNRN